MILIKVVQKKKKIKLVQAIGKHAFMMLIVFFFFLDSFQV